MGGFLKDLPSVDVQPENIMMQGSGQSGLRWLRSDMKGAWPRVYISTRKVLKGLERIDDEEIKCEE
jgi:hypothetical protein